MLPKVTVDKGAIKHILQGADIMAPGLTSSGGCIPEGINKNTVVSIFCEGKELPIAVGILLENSNDM